MEWKSAVQDILGILKEIQQDNKEIKSEVKQIRADIKNNSDKIHELHRKVEELETENQELKGKLLQAQKKTIRNNIVIFGVPEIEDAGKFFMNILKAQLEIDLKETDINNIHRIGVKKSNKPRPVILELVRNTKKQEIFRNITKFKGTGISISNDLVQEERKEQKLIYKHYKLAKDKGHQVKLLKNKLIINGEVYTHEKLKLIEEEEESDSEVAAFSHINNNTPATPIQQYSKVLHNQDPEESPESITRQQDKKRQVENKKQAENTSKSQSLSQRMQTRKKSQTQSAT